MLSHGNKSLSTNAERSSVTRRVLDYRKDSAALLFGTQADGSDKQLLPTRRRTKLMKELNELPDENRWRECNRQLAAPQFLEAIGLINRMKTFLVIEVFEGYQIIKQWKCNDLVRYINELATQPFKVTDELKQYWLRSGLKNYQRIKYLDDVRRQPHGVQTEEHSHDVDSEVVHHHHHHYHYLDLSNRSSGVQHELINSTQNVLHPAMTKTSPLTYRDLRQIFREDNPTPSIETRKHCIIVCLPPISCVIMSDRVFIHVVDDIEMDDLILNLQRIQLRHLGKCNNLEERSEKPLCEQQPCQTVSSFLTPETVSEQCNSSEKTSVSAEQTSLFPQEFESLEVILSTAFQQLDDDISCLELGYTQLAIHNAAECQTTKGVEQMHQLSLQVQTYRDRVDLYDRALNTIINNDEEFCLMELSRLKYEQQVLNSKAFPEELALSSDYSSTAQDAEYVTWMQNMLHDSSEPDPNIESLLEFFDQDVEMFRQRIARLLEKIEHTERLSNFRLALNRNRMLRLDVGSGMLAVIVGVSTAMSGIFGMNLTSKLEDSVFAFYFFTGFNMLTIVIGAYTITCLIRRINL